MTGKRDTRTILFGLALLLFACFQARPAEAITVHLPGYSFGVFRNATGNIDIDVDPDGNLYLARGSRGIGKLAADGDSITWSLARATDFVLRDGGGGYGAGRSLCNCVYTIDSNGAFSTMRQDTLAWIYLALTADSTLYSTTSTLNGSALYRLDRTTGAPTLIVLGGPGPGGSGSYSGLTTGADGKLYVVGSTGTVSGYGLFRLNGSQLVSVATLPHGGRNPVLGPDGTIYVIGGYDYGSGYPVSEVWGVNPVTGETWKLASSGSYFHNWNPQFQALGFDSRTNTIYVEESGVGIWAITKLPPVVASFGPGSATADTVSVSVSWPIEINTPAYVQLERRTEDSEFSSRYFVQATQSGTVSFVDRAVLPGIRYGYRAWVRADSGTVYSPTVWVDVPPLTPPPPPVVIWSEGSISADTSSVTLDWPINPIITGDVRVERRTSASLFGSVGAIHLTGDGIVHFVDTQVARGASYVYRAGVPTDTGWVWSDSLTAVIPAASPPPPTAIWNEGSVTVDTSSVTLDWPIAPIVTGQVRVERRDAGGEYGWIGFVNLTGDGHVHLVDTSVERGAHYVYRAGLLSEGVWDWSDELDAVVPVVFPPAPTAYSLAFARATSLAMQGSIRVDFTVPATGTARVDAYDVHGRRVATSTIDATRTGPYTAQLVSAAPLKPGMYFLRLTLGSATAQSRAIVLGSR